LPKISRQRQNKKMSQDILLHGTAADNTIRCMSVVTTQTVAEAMRRHQTAPTATAALGRALTGALLLGASIKELDRLTVQIRGDGPLGGLTAEVNSQGHARGYARNPEADLPLNAQGKFDVRGVIGQGVFYVMHESGYDVGLHREPYTGSVPLISGEIAKDFTYYLAHSEQIPSAVLLGVRLEPDATRQTNYVAAAGGVMIQIMPGAAENAIREIERSVGALPHTTELIRDGATPLDLLKMALGAMEFEPLGESGVSFACSCSFQRAGQIISSLPRSEVESMLREDGEARFICHFCNEHYLLDGNALDEILAAKS
jgi:molecular chaperone Hsp33